MEDYKTAIAAIVILIVVGIAWNAWMYADTVEIKRVLQRMFSFIPSVAYARLGSDRPNIYMKLDEFKKVYIVNPDAYRLYLITADRTYNGKEYIIGFRGLDFYRYKRWRKKVWYPDFSNSHNEIYREFMTTAVQKDIDQLTKKAQKEMDRSREEMLRGLESGVELKL